MSKNRTSILLAACLTLCLTAPAMAQNSYNQPSSSDVSQQFQSGANRVGQGATQIGQGIKQGAILTWEAIKAGAQTTAAKFNGDSTSAHN